MTHIEKKTITLDYLNLYAISFIHSIYENIELSVDEILED